MNIFFRWPSVVTRDPQTGLHCEINYQDLASAYHVEFLGPSHSHAWIRADKICLYSNVSLSQLVCIIVMLYSLCLYSYVSLSQSVCIIVMLYSYVSLSQSVCIIVMLYSLFVNIFFDKKMQHFHASFISAKIHDCHGM